MYACLEALSEPAVAYLPACLQANWQWRRLRYLEVKMQREKKGEEVDQQQQQKVVVVEE